MRFLPKVVGVISCGFLLCLGLSQPAQASNAASAAGEIQKHEMGAGQSTSDKVIQGEVLRVEGNDCVVRSKNGKVVQLHLDATTLNARSIEPGQQIEAKVDEQNHALSILSVDRRNDKE